MSARIPHLLTRLLSSAELDALKNEMLRQASINTGSAALAWMDAVTLMESHRDSAALRRAKQTPSARRKSLQPFNRQLLTKPHHDPSTIPTPHRRTPRPH